MKIALVNPPPSQRYVHHSDEPLGLLYLVTQLRDKHDVYIVDSFTARLSENETVAILEALGIDILGISMILTGTYRPSLTIASLIKERSPSIITILGGNTATFQAESLAAHPSVDYIVRGEGDFTFPALLEALQSGRDIADVPGISYSRQGKVVHNPPAQLVKDLDILPFPARELLPRRNSYPRSILSARGCPYGCIYCSSAAFWGKSYRMRSVENIIAEIKMLMEEDMRQFTFADDCLTMMPERTKEIAARIKNLNKDCTWGCTGRIEAMSEEMIKTLSSAGCGSIFFGVESGSERVLKRLGRRYTPQDVYEVYLNCLAHGIKPYFSFIIGLPYEEEVDLALTYRLIQRLEGVENGVHILTPLPGTPISKEPEKYGLKLTEHRVEDLDINSQALLATSSFSSEYINEAYRKAVGYSIKALRSSRVINQIAKARTLSTI